MEAAPAAPVNPAASKKKKVAVTDLFAGAKKRRESLPPPAGTAAHTLIDDGKTRRYEGAWVPVANAPADAPAAPVEDAASDAEKKRRPFHEPWKAELPWLVVQKLEPEAVGAATWTAVAAREGDKSRPRLDCLLNGPPAARNK